MSEPQPDVKHTFNLALPITTFSSAVPSEDQPTKPVTRPGSARPNIPVKPHHQEKNTNATAPAIVADPAYFQDTGTAPGLLSSIVRQRQTSLIANFPSDVLQIIFELTTSPVRPWPGADSRISEEVRTALQLSSVCRWWKRIALQTPRLWTDMRFRLGDPKGIEYLVENMIHRAKMVPCSVLVTRIKSETAEHLPICRLNDIPAIGNLEFRFETADVRGVLKPSFKLPSGTVHILNLSFLPRSLGKGHFADIQLIIARFPPLFNLRLQGIGYWASWENNAPRNNSHITTLQIKKSNGLHLHAVLSYFPYLHTLILHGVSLLVPADSSLYTCHSLKTLKLADVHGAKWENHYQFPSLRTVSVFVLHTNKLVDFISRHRTITDLSWGGPITETFLNATTQLERLTIESPLPLMHAGGSTPPFPSLKSLILRSNSPTPNVQEFDAFVRARGLPACHPKSVAKQSSHVLSSISFRRRKDREDPEWYESEFYEESSQQVFEDMWAPLHKEICLSWSHMDQNTG